MCPHCLKTYNSDYATNIYHQTPCDQPALKDIKAKQEGIS